MIVFFIYFKFVIVDDDMVFLCQFVVVLYFYFELWYVDLEVEGFVVSAVLGFYVLQLG